MLVLAESREKNTLFSRKKFRQHAAVFHLVLTEQQKVNSN